VIFFATPSPVPVAGRVVRVVGHDTVAVAGAHVTLHKVTVQKPGPVDSMVSRADGSFSFRIAPDSGVVYLVSARWAGIEYFATPFVVHADSPTPPSVVVVADTSSSAPVRLVARHLIVSLPGADGMRDVVDLFVLNNPGPLTRVGTGPKSATWQAHLPRFAVSPRAGNSDFSAETVQFTDDLVGLFAAIPPGQRDVEVDYEVPAGATRFEVPIDADADISNVVSADKSLRVTGAFTRSDTVIDGKSYARWQGRVTAGTPVVLEFGERAIPSWLMPAMVAVMAVVLIGVTARTLR
jgi:hypothetical protein